MRGLPRQESGAPISGSGPTQPAHPGDEEGLPQFGPPEILPQLEVPPIVERDELGRGRAGIELALPAPVTHVLHFAAGSRRLNAGYAARGQTLRCEAAAGFSYGGAGDSAAPASPPVAFIAAWSRTPLVRQVPGGSALFQRLAFHADRWLPKALTIND